MSQQEKERRITHHMGDDSPDASFWRRFSLAVHAEEAAKTPTLDKEWTFWSYGPRIIPAIVNRKTLTGTPTYTEMTGSSPNVRRSYVRDSAAGCWRSL